MKRISPNEAWTGVADCLNCNIRQSVLFSDLSEADFDLVHRPIDQLTYARGAEIYGMGETATSLFTIRTGLVKLIRFLPDGTHRIVRLLRKTDIIGIESVVSDSYSHSATALHPTELCRLPVSTIKELSNSNSRLFHELMARWHRALSEADRWITEFSTGPSRDRVVRLLLWLSEVEPDGRCELFSREDLGAVLGLTTETASRMMAELKRQGYISEPHTNQFLCDIPNLRRLVA